jgi:hypothetical protein
MAIMICSGIKTTGSRYAIHITRRSTGEIDMDVKDLADYKRALGVQIEQKIREFEAKTGLQVTGFKLRRDEGDAIESVTVKAEI